MVTMPAQAQVADKVSYWVTQGIQNAELTLDGFGADPVEVSILLKGGEAHVGFRSDQPEVRQMLEGALSQLKDSLEREGVVLSGVTVGGSGADGGGRQQGQRRDPAANRVGGAAQAASENRILRAPTSVGRSLDIFV
jgi:flagellar hook-length control protein FliK